MSTADGKAHESTSGQGFTEAELASVTGPGSGEPELDEVEAAAIEEVTPDLDNSFEKLSQKSRRLTEARVKTVVESIFFVSDRPLSLDELVQATAIDRNMLEVAIEKIAATHREGLSGLVLYEVGGGWQFRTDPGSGEYVRRFLQVKPQRLTRAALETLAIIAYRQPVTRPEVEDIRGVDCGAVIKALLERKLIKILGKKEEVGRPILYGTTREFLEFFALRDLASLPTLREFHELTREHQEIVEQVVEKPSAKGTVSALSDPGFQKRMDERAAQSEEDLEALERAISSAEEKTKAAAEVLKPQAPPAPPEDV